MSHDASGTAYDVAWTFAYNPASQIVTQGSSSAVYDYKETQDSDCSVPGNHPADCASYDGLNRNAAVAAPI